MDDLEKTLAKACDALVECRDRVIEHITIEEELAYRVEIDQLLHTIEELRRSVAESDPE